MPICQIERQNFLRGGSRLAKFDVVRVQPRDGDQPVSVQSERRDRVRLRRPERLPIADTHRRDDAAIQRRLIEGIIAKGQRAGNERRWWLKTARRRRAPSQAAIVGMVGNKRSLRWTGEGVVEV